MTEKKIKCPYCGKDTVYSQSNPSRPFCSERCRLIDLGEWADGKYAIPAQNQSSPTEEKPQSPVNENDPDSYGDD